MRGRTNAGGSGTLAIKGNIEQFKVAEGTSVAAGDFVEYKTLKSEDILTYADIQQKKSEQIGENLVVGKCGNSLALLKAEDGKLNIAARYDEKEVTGFCKMRDGRIAVAVNTSPFLVILKVVNDLLLVSAEASGIDGGLETRHEISVEEYNGKLYLLYPERRAESGSYYKRFAVFYIFSENEDETISLERTEDTEIELSGMAQRVTGTLKTFILENYIYYSITEKDSSGKITAEYKGSIAINQEGFSKENDSYPAGMEFIPLTFFDKYAFGGEKDKFYIYNQKSKKSNTIDASSFGFRKQGSSSGAYFSSVYCKYGEDKFAVFFCGASTSYGGNEDYQVAIFQLDESSGEIRMISNIFNPEFSARSNKSLGVFFLGRYVYPTMYVNNATHGYMVSYEESLNLLSDRIDEGYVKTYEGGAAIGVAKQSGSSGDRIDVYVPKA